MLAKNLSVALIAISISACSMGHKTIVDSGGARSAEVALRYEDDLDTCQRISRENFRIRDIPRAWYNWTVVPLSGWILDEKSVNIKRILVTCMKNRGHSVLDTEYSLGIRW